MTRLNILFLKLALCIPAVFTESFALYFGYVTLCSKEVHCWNIRKWEEKKKKTHPCSNVTDSVLECLSLSLK